VFSIETKDLNDAALTKSDMLNVRTSVSPAVLAALSVVLFLSLIIQMRLLDKFDAELG
jgi:hypothetical protein